MKSKQTSSTTLARPLPLLLLVTCCVFLGVGGIFGGLALLIDPSGGRLGLSPDLLESLPIRSFRLPGLFLLIVMGFLPLVASYGLLKRPYWVWMGALNYLGGHHWSWTLTLGLGVVLFLWIALQVNLWDDQPPIQTAFGVLSLVMVGLCLAPSVKYYYAE